MAARLSADFSRIKYQVPPSVVEFFFSSSHIFFLFFSGRHCRRITFSQKSSSKANSKCVASSPGSIYFKGKMSCCVADSDAESKASDFVERNTCSFSAKGTFYSNPSNQPQPF